MDDKWSTRMIGYTKHMANMNSFDIRKCPMLHMVVVIMTFIRRLLKCDYCEHVMDRHWPVEHNGKMVIGCLDCTTGKCYVVFYSAEKSEIQHRGII